MSNRIGLSAHVLILGLAFAIAFLIVMTTLTGCQATLQSGSYSSAKLVVTGSSTVAPLVQEIAVRFEKENPGVRVDVQTGGSSRGIRDATRGVADLGMSSRHLNADEADHLDSTVIAWDGVAFVVHQNNETPELTRDELREIYKGSVTNWSKFGGKDQRIVVSNRAEGRSELELVSNYLGIERAEIKADVIDGETQQSLKTVINNQRAITYTSIGAAQDAITRGEPLKILPLDDVEASSDTVKSGVFPLARPLILVVPKEKSGQLDSLVGKFLEFASNPNVADVVVGLGYVPLENSVASGKTK